MSISTGLTRDQIRDAVCEEHQRNHFWRNTSETAEEAGILTGMVFKKQQQWKAHET